MRMHSPGRREIMTLSVLFEGGLGLLALPLGRLLGYPALAAFHWGAGDAASGGAATLPLLAVFFICLRFPVGPLRQMKSLVEEVVQPLFRQCGAGDLAVIAILAGFGEEMLFRGVLQPAVGAKAGPALGVVLVNVLFGLLHLVTPTYAVYAGILGCYLSWLYEWTGNLLVPITTHGLYDFLALFYLVRGQGRSP
jgi:membrane protease YdiL (CAAX protease family)